MLYVEKIENHRLGANTPFKDVADSLGWDIAIEEANTERSDIDFCLYEKGYAPMKTEEDKAREEQERIALLFLTAADVERGIYKAKNMDFEDIITLVEKNPPEGLDIKALKIELKANNFYRGNPYVDAIGTLLGFTKTQLDNFFETNDYNELLKGEK